MNPVEAALWFQSGGSMPLQPGDKARVRGRDDVFTVLSFDGPTYRLRAASGAELKAGRRTVERV